MHACLEGWAQACQKLFTAITQDCEDDLAALWQYGGLNPLENAKALFYSLLYDRDQISMWILARGEAFLSEACGQDHSPYWGSPPA